MNQFEVGNQQTVINGRKIAAKYLGDRVSSPEVYQSGQTPLVYATGHCHIDSCWLWPFDETKRMYRIQYYRLLELISGDRQGRTLLGVSV